MHLFDNTFHGVLGPRPEEHGVVEFGEDVVLFAPFHDKVRTLLLQLTLNDHTR